jgi:Asp-tRNA(Asn)/Glu-tRNA(Gln) amidotransferase A subunit family amidase
VLLGRPLAVPAVTGPASATARCCSSRPTPLAAHLETVRRRLVAAGAEVVEVELPDGFAALLDAGRLIVEAEAAGQHEAWFAEHAASYAPQIAGLVRAGLGRTAAELARAYHVRAAYRAALEPVLDGVDALLSPVAPGPAALRAKGTGDVRLCAPWSFTGVPSISIPTGTDDDGLPLALQLTGAPAGLERLLGAAAWCERVLGSTRDRGDAVGRQVARPWRAQPATNALGAACAETCRQRGRTTLAHSRDRCPRPPDGRCAS